MSIPINSSAVHGLPLNPRKNCIQRIERLVAEANPGQVPVPLQTLYDIILVLGDADFWYAQNPNQLFLRHQMSNWLPGIYSPRHCDGQPPQRLATVFTRELTPPPLEHGRLCQSHGISRIMTR